MNSKWTRRSWLGATAALPLHALTDPAIHTFVSSIDGSEQVYAIHAPAAESPGPHPLVISLHGAGQNHRQGLRQVLPDRSPAGWIVAAPLGRGSTGYLGIGERDVYEVLDDVKRRYKIDEDRVYLTGVSMGGSGTFSLALSRPDIWAAIAPVCGGAPDGALELAGNALHVPVHIFHGTRDETVPIAIGRDWRDRFQAGGVNVVYREFEGEGHNIAPLAYKDGYVFEWLARHRRVRQPRRVSFASRDYEHGSAYWARFDNISPGELARMDARFEADHRIAIQTSGVTGLTIRPDVGQYQLNVDGEKLTTSGPAISLSKKSGVWRAIAAPEPSAKHAGYEGPIHKVVSGPHSYVYGTRNADDEEIWRRKEIAQRAADWSGARARPLASFPVVAAPPSGNLVVFGTAETNELLAKWDAQLPLGLKQDKAQQCGLLYITALDNRLVLISSGLPWWTGATAAQREGFRWQWLSLPYRLLWSFPDYVLFEKSCNNVIASGYFDENWKLPAAARAAMQRTGAVTLKT